MATWQFSIVFLPKKWAVENNYAVSALYGKDGYDTEDAWKDYQPSPEFVDVVSNFLPPSKSWHKDLMSWGNEKDSDIQVWNEDNIIDGIHIRLALNANYSALIIKLIKMANELNCVLFFPELKTIVEANEFELKKALQNSNAARFVKDPKCFIDNLSK